MQGSWLGSLERYTQSTPILCFLFAFLLSPIAALGQTQSQPAAYNEHRDESRDENRDEHLTEILSYIHTGWDTSLVLAGPMAFFSNLHALPPDNITHLWQAIPPAAVSH
jgi:hypothetical protein